MEKVDTGSQFQYRQDKLRNRLEEHEIESISAAVRNLRNTISDFGPVELIRELWWHELIRSTSFAYLGEDSGITPKMTEYLYGLATTVSPTESQPSVGFYDVIDALSLVYHQLRLKQSEKLAAASTIEERRQAHVQDLLLERELTTGRFGHGRQRREFVRRVYSTVDDELLDINGFSATQAVEFADAIQQFFEDVEERESLLPLVHRIIDVGDGPFQVRTEDVIQNLEAGYTTVWVNVAKYDHHRFNPLDSNFELGEFREYEDSFGSLRKVAPSPGFTPDSIIEFLESSLDEFEAFLEELSVEIGTYPSDLENQDGSFEKFDYPFDHNPIHQFPFVFDSEGNYYLGPKNAMWFSLSTRLYYDILGSAYQGVGGKKIGGGVEDWVEGCLKNINDNDVNVLSNVEYDYEDGEADFVLLYEDELIVVECKTRGLRIGSRKGPFGSFEDIQSDVQEIIGTPYQEQAMKLINGIKDGNVDELSTEEETVNVSPEQFSEYHPVVVVARPLDFVGTILHADMLEFQEEAPYVTDVYSIQTICRHLPNSREFLSYITKRIEIGVTGRAFSIDEIDYLGAFLDHSLEYPDIPEEGIVDIIHAGSDLERIYGEGVSGDMDRI